MNEMETAKLWRHLVEEGIVSGEKPDVSDAATPWYVRVMMGIAGWMGAGFLLSFVAVGFAVLMESVPALLTVGALICAGAGRLYKKGEGNDFLDQFAFAVSLSGQGLFFIGLFQGLEGSDNVVAFSILGVEGLLFFYMDNFLHRIWSAMVALCALLYLLGTAGFAPFAQAVLTAFFAWVWLNEFNDRGYAGHMRALGYALVIVLTACMVTWGGGWTDMGFLRSGDSAILVDVETGRLLGAVMVGLLFSGVALKLLKGEGISPARGPGVFFTAGIVVAALITVKAPGIGSALVVLLIGFSHGNRVLWGTGAAGMLCYLSQYYYFLELTLLQKSALLSAAGIALLGIRAALKYRWHTHEDTK